MAALISPDAFSSTLSLPWCNRPVCYITTTHLCVSASSLSTSTQGQLGQLPELPDSTQPQAWNRIEWHGIQFGHLVIPFRNFPKTGCGVKVKPARGAVWTVRGHVGLWPRANKSLQWPVIGQCQSQLHCPLGPAPEC